MADDAALIRQLREESAWLDTGGFGPRFRNVGGVMRRAADALENSNEDARLSKQERDAAMESGEGFQALVHKRNGRIFVLEGVVHEMLRWARIGISAAVVYQRSDVDDWKVRAFGGDDGSADQSKRARELLKDDPLTPAPVGWGKTMRRWTRFMQEIAGVPVDEDIDTEDE